MLIMVVIPTVVLGASVAVWGGGHVLFPVASEVTDESRSEFAGFQL